MACRGSASGLSAPHGAHRSDHGSLVRLRRLVSRDDDPPRRDQVVGSGHRSGLRRRARRNCGAGLAPADLRTSVYRTAELVQSGWQGACGPRSPNARDAVGRRSSGLASERLRDRRSKPEPPGVESVPAVGDAVSRDVRGVAHGLSPPFCRVGPCRTVRNCSLRATKVEPAGDCPKRPTSRSLRKRSRWRCAMRFTLIPTLLLAPTVAVLLAVSGQAASGTSQRPVYQSPQSYYLALGDSIAYGLQPTKKPGARASTFDTGYVDVFAARLRKLSPKIEVVNYGCPGESTVTFVRGGCDWLKHGGRLHDAFGGSQLKAALSFLRAHPGRVSPITLTLWGGDLAPLSAKGKRAPRAIASFAARFKEILEQLRAAAPNAEIIVTGAWNLEADRLAQVEPAYRSVDASIRNAAAASRARVANMFAALNGPGSVRTQKARLCSLTFFCSKGGDPHPTDAGYRAMAGAFMAASGYPRKP